MDVREELQASLGAAFSVDRELGGGGMSRVFVARDATLGRDVVVKVLPPEMTAGVSAERFRREIQLGAQLQHPHIVPLLSAGASGSLLFYSMPFLAGESLRERLSRDPALSCAEATRIWREMLDALSYAHSRGIVHRDIKPENILLSNKHAMVTDFGIARAVSAATGEARMTSTGLALGTPAYMAPEQAAGDRDVDARADIYSAGLVMYEMLAGRQPFVADTVQQMVMAQLTKEPSPLTPTDPSTPRALTSLVTRCLAKDPSARPQSADEILGGLDSLAVPSAIAATHSPRLRTVMAVAGLVIVALGVLGAVAAKKGVFAFGAPTAPPNDSLRLVVLLAENKFDPVDATLAQNFRDGVLSGLAKEPWLNVITPGALEQAASLFGGMSPTSLTRDTIIYIAKRTRTNAYVDLNLSRAGTGYVFAAEVKGALNDNSVVRATAAANSASEVPAAIEHVVVALRKSMVRERGVLPPTPMLGVERTASAAIPPFLQGLSDIERRQYLEAAAKFLSAIQIDSTFVEAWRMRYIALVNAGVSTAERLQALSTAYRLRDRLRSPFWRAEITTDYLRVTGQHARVIAVFDSLLRIAPRGGFINNQGLAYSAIRRYDAALSTYQRSIDPAYSRLTVANSNLVGALLRLNRIEDAKAEYTRMLAHADSLQAIPRQARYSLATATRDWRAFAQLADDEARGTSTSNRIRSLEYRRALAAVRGQIARFDSLEVLRTGEYLAVGAPGNYLTAFGTAARLHAAVGDSAGSRRLLAQGLSKVPLPSLHPLDRPYVTLATALAWAGDPSRADSLLTDWSRNYPVEFKPADSLDILLARGEVALARGNPREALQLFKRADVEGCIPCFYPKYARAYDALRMSDSSLAFYERYATATAPGNPIGDAFELARTYRRLGELYEERRDWKHAVQRYQDFVNLWEHADPSLRQAVNDVRARIERIRPKAS